MVSNSGQGMHMPCFISHIQYAPTRSDFELLPFCRKKKIKVFEFVGNDRPITILHVHLRIREYPLYLFACENESTT